MRDGRIEAALMMFNTGERLSEDLPRKVLPRTLLRPVFALPLLAQSDSGPPRRNQASNRGLTEHRAR